MAETRGLVALSEAEVQKLPEFATVKPVDVPLPKTAVAAADFDKTLTTLTQGFKAPVVAQPADKAFAGVKLTTDLLDSIAAIHGSPSPTAELVLRGLTPELTMGAIYSAGLTLNYMQMKTQHQLQLGAAKTPQQKDTVEQEFQQGIATFLSAYASAGLKDLKAADLDAFATTLNSKPANFNAITTIANTATAAAAPATAAGQQPLGSFVMQTALVPNPVVTVTSLPGIVICPLTGTFSYHLGHTVVLQVRLPWLCQGAHWWQWNFCWKIVTLGTASFSVSVNVSYNITCSPCKVTVSGHAVAQACLGSVCASCSATITAAAGIIKTGSGASCSYGLSLNAALNCQLAGWTLLNLNAPFSWAIKGPCLPGC